MHRNVGPQEYGGDRTKGKEEKRLVGTNNEREGVESSHQRDPTLGEAKQSRNSIQPLIQHPLLSPLPNSTIKPKHRNHTQSHPPPSSFPPSPHDDPTLSLALKSITQTLGRLENQQHELNQSRERLDNRRSSHGHHSNAMQSTRPKNGRSASGPAGTCEPSREKARGVSVRGQTNGELAERRDGEEYSEEPDDRTPGIAFHRREQNGPPTKLRESNRSTSVVKQGSSPESHYRPQPSTRPPRDHNHHSQPLHTHSRSSRIAPPPPATEQQTPPHTTNTLGNGSGRVPRNSRSITDSLPAHPGIKQEEGRNAALFRAPSHGSINRRNMTNLVPPHRTPPSSHLSPFSASRNTFKGIHSNDNVPASIPITPIRNSVQPQPTQQQHQPRRATDSKVQVTVGQRQKRKEVERPRGLGLAELEEDLTCSM